MFALPALVLSQQVVRSVVLSLFFSVFGYLLQSSELLFNIGYLFQVSLVSFPVLTYFISPLNGFSSPIVTATYKF